MVQNRIDVDMCGGAISEAPDILTTPGLGSCVAIAFYDANRKIGGMAHIMLPDSREVDDCNSPYRYADTAISALLEKMLARGSKRGDIVAKICGGAQMFSHYENSGSSVGEQNISAIKNILDKKQISVIGEDSGGNKGRSIEFFLDTGKLRIKSMDSDEREI
jgi:chemotaxis protein CheD